ncbi:flagellar hook-associated protein FlgK [Vibrio barjaei]|uniref:flagellar hook-associated protein FlgK n=1 Tax=Vibrio barjaei TaxID=1676683 RepID=UPI002283C4F4|nr:flagellar hook-associated protein FlgK [Vibrio barjaei]MCY9872311.1 flagellar hook-associated protein FlgK [Vibrio barjaei]
MSMINIGLSGVRAFDAALNITALNTANSNTEGYSRQRVIMGAVSGGVYAAGRQMGSGVEVTSIRRVVDESAVNNLQIAVNSQSYSSVYLQSLSFIEEVLDADGLKVNENLNDFFASINKANSDPSSVPLRFEILQKADLLANTINSVNARVNDNLNTSINTYDTEIGAVNSKLAAIAGLNAEIEQASAAGQDTAGLKDHLDTLVKDLSSNLSLELVWSGEGTVSIATANGDPLVIGSEAAQLSRDLSSGNPSDTSLKIDFDGTVFNLKKNVGGSLGARADYIATNIDPILETVDEIAAFLADEVNAALGAGFDLNGNPGQPLFSYTPGKAGQTLKVEITDVNELALSADGSVGDGSVLKSIYDISSKVMTSGPFSGKTMADSYSLMLGHVGSETAKYITLNENNTKQLATAQQARDSVSGVNTDEEAANLMNLMNAYNANMKVVSAGNDLFQTVLNAF